ncbi:MAG: four-carbon acid sugar kinase family protein [Candidatus Methylomirabilia bacterium]
MPYISIIADDLTGAADTGAPFARARLVTLITLVGGPTSHARHDPQGDVLVLSTESRHLARAEAEARVRLAAGRVGKAVWVYKKIDSTLRGHPGPELATLMDALGPEQALVAPAFPAQGRTTVGGQQRVDGLPLEQTPLGREGASSDLSRLFGPGPDGVGGSGRPVQLIELSTVRRGPAAVTEMLRALGPAVVIADAETESDLATLAGAVVQGKVTLVCGSAGLARALARTLPLAPTAPRPKPPRGAPGPVLTVAGSRHPQTLRQVDVARQQGVAVVRPDPEFVITDGKAIERSAQSVVAHLAAGRDVILTTAGLDEAPMGGQPVAVGLGRIACAVVARTHVGGLVLTGGDVAAAVCAELGTSALWLMGEVQPGIALSVMLGGALPGVPVVTKAGGFGSGDALIVAADHAAARYAARISWR